LPNGFRILIARLADSLNYDHHNLTTIIRHWNCQLYDTIVVYSTISEVQEDIIKSVLKTAMQQTPPETGNPNKPDPLDSLVANGTITKDQETSINFAFEAAKKAYLR